MVASATLRDLLVLFNFGILVHSASFSALISQCHGLPYDECPCRVWTEYDPGHVGYLRPTIRLAGEPREIVRSIPEGPKKEKSWSTTLAIV